MKLFKIVFSLFLLTAGYNIVAMSDSDGSDVSEKEVVSALQMKLSLAISQNFYPFKLQINGVLAPTQFKFAQGEKSFVGSYNEKLAIKLNNIRALVTNGEVEYDLSDVDEFLESIHQHRQATLKKQWERKNALIQNKNNKKARQETLRNLPWYKKYGGALLLFGLPLFTLGGIVLERQLKCADRFDRLRSRFGPKIISQQTKQSRINRNKFN